MKGPHLEKPVHGGIQSGVLSTWEALTRRTDTGLLGNPRNRPYSTSIMGPSPDLMLKDWLAIEGCSHLASYHGKLGARGSGSPWAMRMAQAGKLYRERQRVADEDMGCI